MSQTHKLKRTSNFVTSVIPRWCGLVFLIVLATTQSAQTTRAEPMRLGWQVPWATQGQIVMALKNSDIPARLGLQLSYVGFAYGGPLNRAALAGELDVLLTADQPALALLARDPTFRIVARLMYNRVCIYVPPKSAVLSLADLSGRRVSGPVGAAAERIALTALADAAVDLSGVKFGNLDMTQQSAVVRRAGGGDTWTGVDALYGFDPLPAVYEEAGLVRMLHCGRVVALVVARGEMLNRRRSELIRFLQALALSWVLFAREPVSLNKLFSNEARLEASHAALNQAASIEPNSRAAGLRDVHLRLSDEDTAIIAQAARFLRERGIVRDLLEPRAFIDLTVVDEAFEDSHLLEISHQIRLK